MSLFSLLTDVLFIGHSLVGPTLPTVLDATLREMGQPVGGAGADHQRLIAGL